MGPGTKGTYKGRRGELPWDSDWKDHFLQKTLLCWANTTTDVTPALDAYALLSEGIYGNM